MTNPGEDRAALEARNAAMRDKIGDLLDTYHKQTERLQEAQQARSALSARLTSPDGLVEVTVDSSGMMTGLKIAPSAFERSRPDALSRMILDLTRRGAIQVRQQANDLMKPLTEGLPDLSDLVAGAPSLAALVPKLPEPPAPDPAQRPTGYADSGSIMSSNPMPQPPVAPPPPPAPKAAPKPAARRARPSADEDEMPDSWMREDDL